MKTAQKRTLIWLLPLSSILLTIGLVELALGSFYPVPFAAEHNMYYVADPFTGYRLQPQSVGRYPNEIVAAANKHGHRDREVTLGKPPGTLRIMAIGDSFTVGAHVEQREAYPEVLEALLESRLERPVEVTNAGVGGWQPYQYRRYYEHYGRFFEADIVLVGFFVGNDSYDQMERFEQTSTAIMGRRITREAAQKGRAGLKIRLYAASNLARLVMNRGLFVLSHSWDSQGCRDFSKQYLATQRARLRNHVVRTPGSARRNSNAVQQIAALAELAKEDSSNVVVVLIPDELQVNETLRSAVIEGGREERFDFSMPQTLHVEMMEDSGIATLDLLPSFLAASECLYLADGHWNPAGHALAAAVIAGTSRDPLREVTGTKS